MRKPVKRDKFNKKKIITFLIGMIVFGLIGGSVMVLAKNGNGGFQIKDSYIEVQKSSYPQNIALVKKESGKEEITGQVKIVDQYLISDLPENKKNKRSLFFR